MLGADELKPEGERGVESVRGVDESTCAVGLAEVVGDGGFGACNGDLEALAELVTATHEITFSLTTKDKSIFPIKLMVVCTGSVRPDYGCLGVR